jgi:threonylcarbamoyladenosine tRNA methylthiotransferase MtaB
MATPRTVAFQTLGCKLNFSETSAIASQFRKAGYHIAGDQEQADIFILNTCSVTEFADRKCRKAVRQVLRNSPEAKIVVIGCYAQLKPDEIVSIPGVDLVLGAGEKFQVLQYIDGLEKAHGKGMIHSGQIEKVHSFAGAFSFGDRTRSFLKVQDGCDYQCAFCTIPLARGKSRSDTIANVVSNARYLGEKGIREIVLTGVNIGDFGNGTAVIEGKRSKKEAMFIDLIKQLDQVEEIMRFRISSIEPNLCTDEIINFVAHSRRFVPHFHMPLQSGNNKQLRQMRRRYKRELYANRVNQIKSLMPHACIGVDVIVGFPGETTKDFLESYRFIQSLDVSYLHIFTYSERPDTLAAKMDAPVPMKERRTRNEMLRILSEKKKRAFYREHLGEIRSVLLEKSNKSGFLSGFTDNYIKIQVPENEGFVNTMMDVKLDEIDPSCVFNVTIPTSSSLSS